ncbi:MAG: hypothetical protein DHS20C01_12600 [marine bacterium B5-7]|nr:MAG: hypothetical protein DHS20C01_12600 [marine bacterium B5-7]
MRNLARIYAVIIVVLFATILPSFANADRTLIRNDDITVYVDESLDCDQSGKVTIESSGFEIFEADSIQMQTLIDATQAMLRYECPQIEQINISGFLKGLPDSVFAGFADGSDLFKVTSKRSITSKEVKAETTSVSANSDQPIANDIDREIDVVSIKLDMTVNEVSEIMDERFGSKPSYDRRTGVLTFDSSGCLDGDDRDTELKCINAWFTDKRVATLYRLNYKQVVDAELDDIRGALIDKFGRPDADEKIRKANGREMIWRSQSVSADGRVIHEELNARLIARGDIVVVDLELNDPDQIPAHIQASRIDSNSESIQGPKSNAAGKGKLDLTL